ncbi:MAG: ribbon-helix-helix domain-containing protein [Candidatus Nealsonbacteria bacterium DGGOD1a]|jgi:Ribbon-helix-helix protein, copG family.|nr:MAG: ribbon-helix-helix domain-containing protein [Candidatus Nealsonbacteria bacterium DGGOD1a]
MENQNNSTTYQRVDITLPKETVRLLEKIAKRGDRSRLVDQAIRYFAKEMSRTNLKKQLKDGAIVNASRDLNLVEEWFSIDNEVCPSK